MKISEVLARVKEVKPNPFSDDTLLTGINDIEAKVQTEVLGENQRAWIFTPYRKIWTRS